MAATLLAPVCLYFVTRAAAVGISPAVAAAFPPKDASSLLRPLATAVAQPRFVLPAQVVALAQKGAKSAPLAFEPFVIAAKAEERAGNLARAILLTEEARRRRPSFLLTRVQLIAYYQKAGRIPDLLAEVDFALRLNDQVRQAILPELVKLVADPQGRAALAPMLARSPEWKTDFFRVASRRPPRPQDALALLDLTRQLRPAAGVQEERNLYLQSLVAAGQFKRARELALGIVPAVERQRHRLLFDGSFRGALGVEPFAWVTGESSAGRSEIVSSGSGAPHLNIDYFGGSDATLIEQTLALEPGQYQLSFAVRSETGVSAGDIIWSLFCLPNQKEIARVGADGAKASFRTIRTKFAVPVDACAGQKLRLLGQPGDISSATNAQIANVEVVREN